MSTEQNEIAGSLTNYRIHFTRWRDGYMIGQPSGDYRAVTRRIGRS